MENKEQKFIVLATPKFPFHKFKPIPQVFKKKLEANQRMQELKKRKFEVRLMNVRQ